MDGDQVVVAPGFYFETIDLLGKAIALQSSDGPEVTVIDAQGSGSVVSCISGEGPDTLLCGFTVTGGMAEDGGGMFNGPFGRPTVANCVFKQNAATDDGGGMAGGDPMVTDCVFFDNTSASFGGGMIGGGIYSTRHAIVTDCLFVGNTGGCRR